MSVALTLGCNDTAVVLRVTSNQMLDSVCVGLDADGAHRFGRRYDVSQPAGLTLPQTLSVLAGGKSAFQEQSFGYRRGIESARSRRTLSFRGGQVERFDVALDTCAPVATASATFRVGAQAPGPFDRAALVSGPDGPQLLAVAAGQAARFAVGADALGPLPGGVGSPPAGPVSQLVIADVDDDCQKDALLLPAAVLWTRAADGSFVEQAGALPAGGGAGAAAADFDGDGTVDLVLVGGTGARLLLGDGAGHFREQAAPFDVAPTDATSVAVGDLDGDGTVDIVVGQGSQAPDVTRVYLNDAKGSGHFAWSPASLPPRKERDTALALGDVDGDGDLDLVVAHADGPVRLYVNRGNAFFEDRSFRGLPDQVVAAVPTLLLYDLNLDCLPDLVIPRPGAAPLVWLNAGSDQFIAGPALGGAAEARGAVADDVNGDGLPDLVLFGAGGLVLLEQK